MTQHLSREAADEDPGYPMPACHDCLAGDTEPCEHPPMNGCPAGYPCIFPFECRNIDIHEQRPACLGSKEYRERKGCAGHQIAWFPNGLPEDEEMTDEGGDDK